MRTKIEKIIERRNSKNHNFENQQRIDFGTKIKLTNEYFIPSTNYD